MPKNGSNLIIDLPVAQVGRKIGPDFVGLLRTSIAQLLAHLVCALFDGRLNGRLLGLNKVVALFLDLGLNRAAGRLL